MEAGKGEEDKAGERRRREGEGRPYHRGVSFSSLFFPFELCYAMLNSKLRSRLRFSVMMRCDKVCAAGKELYFIASRERRMAFRVGE